MTQTDKNPRTILSRLGLSESEVQLYLALVERGALTARELTTLTNAKRPTVYYALRQLMDRGLVTQGADRFQAAAPESLSTIVKMRQNELASLADEVIELIPALKKNSVAHEGAPAVTYFTGEEAMKRAIMDTLYCKSGQIDSIAPHDNFFWQVGQEFSANYVAERVGRRIKTRHLWEKELEPKILASSYKGLADVHLLPKEMVGHFRTTVFIYDQEVMYISSRDSGFVLIVKSREHFELMQAMFNTLWAVSKPIKLD